MDNIQTVYTSMIWNNSQWVGLAINLDMGYVEILDPMPDLYGDRRVEGFIKSLVNTLSYPVKKIAMCELTQFIGLKPFVWRRIPHLYNNSRLADCGLVSMKFLEMHTHGDPVSITLTYRTVTDLCK